MVLKGHRSIANQVRFNPDKHLIISSGVEKVIKVNETSRLIPEKFPFHASASSRGPERKWSQFSVPVVVMILRFVMTDG